MLYIISISLIKGQGGAIEPLSNKYNWCENQKVGCKCNENVDFWRAIIDKDFIKYHPKKTIITDTNIYKGYNLDTIFNLLYGKYKKRIDLDSVIKYSDNKFRKELFVKLLEYVTKDSAKIIKLTTLRKNEIVKAADFSVLYMKLIEISKYLRNNTTLNFLKNIVYKSKNNRLVVNASITLIKYNEKELAFNTLKKLWYQKNSESYNYSCHEGFKALNNNDGIKFLKFAALDSIVCLSLDACVKLIELGYSDYSKDIILRHLHGKYSLICVYLLLKHYYTVETIELIKALLNNTPDEKLKYCGNLLLKKFESNIIDY